jgi:diguanylate cyclase (GGDEF)-like protein
VAPFFLMGAVGVTAAATTLALGYGMASLIRRRHAPTDVLRHGVVRALVVLALLPIFAQFDFGALSPRDTMETFTIGLALVYGLLAFGISGPISAFTFHIPIVRIWRRVAADPRTWVVGAANVLWATAVCESVLRGQPIMTMIMWIPALATAMLLRTIDEQHAELHRLRLVRDAVQAMLGDRDPIPQINAILATLRVPSFDETVTVLAATSNRVETWRTVTLLGPALSPAGDELRRRLLVRMKFSGTPFTTLRDEYYIAYAFGAQLTEGEFLGALIVHRRPDRALSNEQIAQFTNAAHELAPLLRDMRSIAAAQSAATIDGLTTLYNRAATIERLITMLEEVSVADRGAVLLLDIDHFKKVNDELGHAAGDDVLRRIGGIIKNTVRGGDTAGRIGGEEFLVVMPGASRDIALTVGERLRLAIALGGMRYASGAPITASIGVAAAGMTETAETLLARADKALYEAKNTGRNRIVEDIENSA